MRARGGILGRNMMAALSISWFYGYTQLRRNIFWSFHYALSPLAFFFFIYIYGGRLGAPYAIAGGLVMITLAASVSMETEAAFNRIVLKLQEVYVASPINPTAYVLGLAMANGLSAIPGMALMLSIAGLLADLTPRFFLAVFSSLPLIWLTFSSFGFLLSTLARDVKDLWTWTPIITGLLSVLPPVFYPLELLPGNLRWIAYAIPSATASRLIQESLGVVDLGGEAALLWIALATHTGVALTILLKKVRWRLP